MQQRMQAHISSVTLAVLASALVLASLALYQNVARATYVHSSANQYSPYLKANYMDKARERAHTLRAGDVVFARGNSPTMVNARKNLAEMEQMAAKQAQVHTVSLAALRGQKVSRDLLLKAGYDPAVFEQNDIVVTSAADGDTVEFTKDVIKRVVANEVQDFFQKVDLAAEVGGFVVRKAMK